MLAISRHKGGRYFSAGYCTVEIINSLDFLMIDPGCPEIAVILTLTKLDNWQTSADMQFN